MQPLYYVLMVLFITVCLFLILLVLIQKGRGGGLSGAFGGAGGNTAFGTKTGDVLTWATSIVFGVFLLLAVFLNLVANRIGGSKPMQTAGSSQQTAPGTGGPAPSNNPQQPQPVGR